MKISGSDKATFISKVVSVCVLFALTGAACVFGHLAVSGGSDIGRYLPHVKETSAFRAMLIAALSVVLIQFIILTVLTKRAGSIRGNTENCNEGDRIGNDATGNDADSAIGDHIDAEYLFSESAETNSPSEAAEAAEAEEIAEAAEIIEATEYEPIEPSSSSSSDDSQKSVQHADTAHSKMSVAHRIIASIASYLSVLPFGCSLSVFYFALSYDSLGAWGNAITVFSFITALFFIFKMFADAHAGKMICGLGLFVFSALVIASLYLDHEIELNSDFKLLVQFGAAGIILGAMADIRLTLSRISEKWFIALKSVAFVLCAVCSSVMLSASVINSGAFPVSYLVYSRLYLASTVQLGVEVISTIFADRSSYI